ncbi:hypothetical protein [Brucella pseudogrignonensis]|uniref:hypothetical protein n=1 Tax=Brucella pseudogrignonensis TaxID=419475 RepID=UPI003ED101CA
MSKRVTIKDLRGLLSAIAMAETCIESGCEDAATIEEVRGASRCYVWVLNEIRRREGAKSIRSALRDIRAKATRPTGGSDADA